MTTANEIAEKSAAENSLTKTQAKTIVDGVFKRSPMLRGREPRRVSPASARRRSRTRLPARVVVRRTGDFYASHSHQGCSERRSGP